MYFYGNFKLKCGRNGHCGHFKKMPIVDCVQRRIAKNLKQNSRETNLMSSIGRIKINIARYKTTLNFPSDI